MNWHCVEAVEDCWVELETLGAPGTANCISGNFGAEYPQKSRVLYILGSSFIAS